jgi:glycosyltransferase involved in cell wall biosynthesis
VKPCLLITIYEHKDEIGGVVSALEYLGLPCLVIDDGSGAETRRVLDALARAHPWLSVHSREGNGGRGAALKTGYRLAARRGFSHAVQLDADGQHDASDVPRFLEEIARDPRALVLGAPLFDATAPRSRFYGRQLSRAMVWLATLSFDVVDPLCGFRAIPLAPTVALLDQVRMGDHMEFDPELLIHLHRRGIPVRTLPTRVVYNPGGLSHFDTWRDNARLSRVYARSLFSTPGILIASWRGCSGEGADEAR